MTIQMNTVIIQTGISGFPIEGGTGHPMPQGFSSLLLKPYIKGVTHSQEVGWWRTLMVECVTLFWIFSAYGTTD